MKSLRDVRGTALEWKQTGMMERSYELLGDERVVATLRWEKAFGSLATAHTADGTWTFKRTGFLTPIVTVRLSLSERDIAIFRPAWGGGGELTAGAHAFFEWKRRGFWSGVWGFERRGGGDVLHYESKFSVLTRAADLHIEPSAYALAEMPLLATLGWYLLMLMAEDEASAAIIIA